ncbi:hypothetical protein JHK82_049895 [Glycine max]|nr:hypothetical protein JHK86_049772 [Glycine max]KAG4935604.1 hypothetical protein JHK85_050523 [Glycine max]KAG5091117.1 hypothetical protein JHK82_049895 [Glycine max]KAG5094225.1 hypothetical protein JHK84_049813 [Glycine max]
MLLKGSLSKPDWLRKAHMLSEEAFPLSQNKTLENVEPESSTLSPQSARPARTLSLLVLSASKPA